MIIVVLVVLVVVVSVTWYFHDYRIQAREVGTLRMQVGEMETFSCPAIVELGFEYPVFKGWEVSSTKSEPVRGNVGCFIALRSTEGVLPETNGQIMITKQPNSEKDVEIPATAISFPNPNGVPYVYVKENSLHEIKNFGYVIFYGKRAKYWVSLNAISEKSGFPTEEFFKTVIGSFRITE